MTKLSAEARVGIFVVAGLVLLAMLSFRMGDFSLTRGRDYTIQAFFDSATGLAMDAPVEIAGVEVGRVNKIQLEGGKALVTMRIFPGVKISQQAKALMRTRGILGDKFIELIPGPVGTPVIGAGGTLERTEPTTDMDTLMKVLGEVAKDIKSLTQSFSSVLGGAQGEDTLRSILEDLKQTIHTIKQTVQQTDADFTRMVSNLSDFSDRLREVGETNMDDVGTILVNIRKASGQIEQLVAGINDIAAKINKGEGTLGRLVQEEETVDNLNRALVSLKEIAEKINRGEGSLGRLITKEDTAERIDETLDSIKAITGKIDRGEGSLGKLVNEAETVDKLNATLTRINDYLQKDDLFRTYLDYRGEYLFDQEGLKSYVTLRIQPREDKYYLLQVIDDPGGNEKVTETTRTIDGVTTTEKIVEVEKDELKFSAQVAKRFYDLGLRGGIFENTGGFAFDYYLFKDRLALSLEAFDWSFEDNPHLKFRADFSPFRHFYLTAGVDDFISGQGRESFFFGAGLSFSDEDIKTLISNVNVSAAP